MATNPISTLSPLDLLALCQRVLSALNVSPNPFGIPSQEIAALTDAANNLDDKSQALEQAESSYRAAVRARQAARKYAARSLGNLARTAFANPANTPTMIAELGLNPHSTSRTRVVPVTPVKLIATPQLNGELVLDWDKLTNGSNVIFRVEGLSEGVWTSLGETTASRAKLTGYAPGVPASFRIVATKNGLVAPPSVPVAIYAASAAPNLRLAA